MSEISFFGKVIEEYDCENMLLEICDLENLNEMRIFENILVKDIALPGEFVKVSIITIPGRQEFKVVKVNDDLSHLFKK